MIKKICIIAFILSFLLSTTAFATTLDEEYEKQYEISGAKEVFDSLPDDVSEALSEWGLNVDTINSDVNIESVFLSILKYITSTLTSPLSTVGIILTILALCSTFSILSSNERQKEVVSYISAVILCGGVILPISDLISKTGSAISLCCGFNLSLIPVYSGILLASGNVKSLATSNLVFFISQGIELFISVVFVPLVSIYSSISICSSLNIFNNISHISSTFKKAIDWILGIIVTLYTALLTVTGLIASVSDSVTQKVGKFVVNSSVPIVGGVISESLGTILGALKYLKTGIGLYAICAVTIILLPAVVETMLWRYILMITSHIADMLGQNVAANLLESISNGVGLIFSVLISMSIIFLISLVVVVMGGGTG